MAFDPTDSQSSPMGDDTADAPSYFNRELESRSLIVVLGGLNAARSPRHYFQMMSELADFPVNKLYLKDVRGSFYHAGLPPLTNNIDETASYIEKYIYDYDISTCVFLGVSSGGYAGLLLGSLVGADEIFVFSPRTYLDADNCIKYEDYRIRHKLDRLLQIPGVQEEYFDLKTVLVNSQPKTKCHIYFSTNDRIDRINAEHVASTRNVFLHPCEFGDHRIARYVFRDPRFRAALGRSLKTHG